MESFEWKTKDGIWHCHRYGHGPELVIALHGFARKGAQFDRLHLPKGEYTVIAPDLPYHGQTDYPGTFNQVNLLELVQYIVATFFKDSDKPETFHLVGYSLGGRLALKVFPELKDQLQSLHLIAPDGLNTSFAWLVENTPKNWKSWLRQRLERPSNLLLIAQNLQRAGLLNKWTLRYLEKQLGSDFNRARLFNTWQSIGDFSLRPGTLKTALQATAIPTVFYWGERDQVVPHQRILPHLRNLSNVQTHLVQGGHEIVDEKLGKLIQQELQSITS